LNGIRDYGYYIPKYRLGTETVGWNSYVERSAANFDEDSVTMAVAAGIECLKGQDRQKVDGLIFASTTPPYAEKQCAAIVATALDLRRDIFTADVTDVLRSGTTALKTALDSVAAGSANQVLVVAADNRQGAPRSDTERSSGDGAVAFLVSNQNLIAEFTGFHSVTENMLDNWRSPGDPFVQSWEDRFATEEGLGRILAEATEGFFSKYHIEPSHIQKVALYAPDGRRHAQLGRSLGFTADQLQDPLFGTLGNTGAAFPLMLLVDAMEEAKPGQSLLVISYGDGSDVLAFQTTPKVSKISQSSNKCRLYRQSKSMIANYETYARWRNVWATDDSARRPAAASPSVTALWRESDKNIRFYGGQCNSCAYIQYPAQRVCVNCQTHDDFSAIRLAETPGTVFTYSMDYIAGTVDTPLVVVVVNFDGGGRLLCMMTDRELDEISVGMPVEMSFRKLRVVNGIHNYYWKAIPRRLDKQPDKL